MSKKQKCPAFENHERWLVSYADMVTLLFAVFVVLYALNLSEETSQEEVAGSMQESFNTPLENVPVEKQIGPKELGFGIFDHFKGNSAEPPLTKKFPGLKQEVKVIDEEFRRIKMDIEDRLYGSEKFVAGGKTAGQERIVDVQRTAKGFKLKLLARHFYRPGDVHVRREALSDLDQVAKILKDLGRSITIEGHTDSIPPQGNMTNWELSALRATSVLRYLISNHNFPSTKLSAAGYADVRPIAHNGSESGRTLNRRIEIHVNYDPEFTNDPG